MQVDGCLFFQFCIASNAPKETLNFLHTPSYARRLLDPLAAGLFTCCLGASYFLGRACLFSLSNSDFAGFFLQSIYAVLFPCINLYKYFNIEYVVFYVKKKVRTRLVGP